MTPAQLALWLALTAAPDAYHVPGVAISYEATLAHYADAALVPRHLARSIFRVESTNGLYLEARRNLGTKARPKWRLISHGPVMIALKYEREHAAKAGLRWADYDWRDAGDSFRVGFAYLGRLLRAYDYDQRKAVAGYNAGAATVARWMEGWALPAETREYLRKVFR